MLPWVIRSGLRARGFVLLLAFVTIGLGIVQLRGAERDALPEFSPPVVEVQTEALGLSAVEVEQLITVPLEQDLLNGVAFLDTIRSSSIPGLSSIQMVFEPGTDILDARQVVEERLTQAHALPQVSKPPQMLEPVSSTGRVMMIELSSEELSLIDMSLLARWTIRPRLMGVPGVANVSIWGQRERQLQVLVDPARLRAHGVTLQQVIETSANAQFVSNLSFVEASTPGTGGIIETPNQRFGIQHTVPFATPADLAKVVIEETGTGAPTGSALRLGDVADIVQDHQPLIGDAVATGGPALMLVVERLPGANPMDVTSGVEGALDDLRPGLTGITMDSTLFRPGTYIETSTTHLSTALAVGAVLLMLALVLLLSWRAAVVAGVAMLTSVGAAVLVLTWTHASFNAMTVAGLVLALVVVIDDAVSDTGTIARRLGEWRNDPAHDSTSAARVVADTALELRKTGCYVAILAVGVFVPLYLTHGVLGAFMPALATSYALAVAASMLVALVVTPALSLTLLVKAAHERATPVVRRLRPAYRRALQRALGGAAPALVVAGVLLAVGLATLPFLRWGAVPELKDTNLLVSLSGPPGTSLPEIGRVTARMGDEIGAVPGVLRVGGHTGRALLSDQVVGTEAGELWVTLDPGADYEVTRAAVEDIVSGYPGLRHDVSTYPSARTEEVLAQPTSPVTVRIFGEDLAVLAAKADEVKQVLAGIEGVSDPQVTTQSEEPTLEIEVDKAAAARYGIVPGDVRRAAAALLSGIQVGSLFEEQKVFDVVVWGTTAVRHDLSSIEALPIDTPAGRQVRLGDVASVRIGSTPTVIRHVDVSRSVDVTADVQGRDLGAVLEDVRQGLRGVTFPMEYNAAVVDDFSTDRATDRRVMGYAVATAIAILLLIQAAVGGWRLAAGAFVLLPLSLVGGAVGVVLSGGTVSLGSVAGFLAVVGLAARQALTQVRDTDQLARDSGQEHGDGLVLDGASQRFAPLLTSVVGTALVLLPLVVAGPIAGLEIVQPMAVVVLGGLVSTTLLTLFVVPVLHVRFGTSAEADLSLALADRTIDLRDTEPSAVSRA